MKTAEHLIDEIMTLVRRPVDVAVGEIYHEIGLRSFGNGVFHKPPISGEDLGSKKVFYIEEGDLLFSSVFAWEGAVALASENEVGRIGSHRFMTYKVNVDRADPRYLLHYFYGGPGLNLIRQASPGSAGRNKTLGIANFGRQRVLLPALGEQRRIAGILDAANFRIARFGRLREQSKRLVDQLADTLFRSVAERAPLSVVLRHNNEMIYVKSDSRYPITGIYSFGRGLIKRPDIFGKDTAYDRFSIIRQGQVVMSKLNAWEGAIAVVNSEFDGTYVSPEYPSFDIDATNFDSVYVEHLLAWPSLWASLTPRGSMVRRKRTTPATLLATEVPMPSLAEQRNIAQKLSMARRSVEAAGEQTTQVANLRSALLNSAFSGEI